MDKPDEMILVCKLNDKDLDYVDDVIHYVDKKFNIRLRVVQVNNDKEIILAGSREYLLTELEDIIKELKTLKEEFDLDYTTTFKYRV